MVKEIKVSLNRYDYGVMQVDELVYNQMMKFTWYAAKGYPTTHQHGKQIKASRMVMTLLGVDIEDRVVDHINGDKLNNTTFNLRVGTDADNLKNRPGATGVHQHRRKFVARITANGVRHYLGLFDTKEDALTARRAAELKYFGEWAPRRELV